MNAQLREVEAQLRANGDRVRNLSVQADEARMASRPSPQGWSAAECLAHLRLSTEAFLPSLRSVVSAGQADGCFRLDMLGRILTWVLEPPVRFKVKAPRNLCATASGDEVAKFLASQDELLEVVTQLDGVALDRVKVRSPASARIRYSAWSSLLVTAAHQRRHLWQAERAAGVMQ